MEAVLDYDFIGRVDENVVDDVDMVVDEDYVRIDFKNLETIVRNSAFIRLGSEVNSFIVLHHHHFILNGGHNL